MRTQLWGSSHTKKGCEERKYRFDEDTCDSVPMYHFKLNRVPERIIDHLHDKARVDFVRRRLNSREKIINSDISISWKKASELLAELKILGFPGDSYDDYSFESPTEQFSHIIYKPNAKTKVWMAKQDAIYLLELEHTGELQNIEPGVWYLWEQEKSPEIDIGTWWATTKVDLPDIANILARAEEEAKHALVIIPTTSSPVSTPSAALSQEDIVTNRPVLFLNKVLEDLASHSITEINLSDIRQKDIRDIRETKRFHVGTKKNSSNYPIRLIALSADEFSTLTLDGRSAALSLHSIHRDMTKKLATVDMASIGRQSFPQIVPVGNNKVAIVHKCRSHSLNNITIVDTKTAEQKVISDGRLEDFNILSSTQLPKICSLSADTICSTVKLTSSIIEHNKYDKERTSSQGFIVYDVHSGEVQKTSAAFRLNARGSFGSGKNPTRFTCNGKAYNQSTVKDLVCISNFIAYSESTVIYAYRPDNTLNFWDLTTDTCTKTFGVGEKFINFLALSPNKKLLVSSSRDKEAETEIKIWDVETGRCLGGLNYTNKVTCLEIISDNLFAIGDDVGYISVNNLSDGSQIKLIKHPGPVCAMTSLSEHTIVSANPEDQVILLESPERPLLQHEVCEVLRALQTNTSVMHLSLRDIQLDLRCFIEVAKVLEVNQNITSLDLSNTNLDDQAAALLAEVLSANKHLKLVHLDLQGNTLSESAAQFLRQIVTPSQEMTSTKLKQPIYYLSDPRFFQIASQPTSATTTSVLSPAALKPGENTTAELKPKRLEPELEHELEKLRRNYEQTIAKLQQENKQIAQEKTAAEQQSIQLAQEKTAVETRATTAEQRSTQLQEEKATIEQAKVLAEQRSRQLQEEKITAEQLAGKLQEEKAAIEQAARTEITELRGKLQTQQAVLEAAQAQNSAIPDIVRRDNGFRDTGKMRPKRGSSMCLGIFEEVATKTPWIGKVTLASAEIVTEVAACKEKIASDIYAYFGAVVPQTVLSRQPIITHPETPKTDLGFAATQTHAVYLMSEIVPDFHTFGKLLTFTGGAELHWETADHRSLPVIGLGKVLAIANFLYDIDVIGASGANLGYQVVDCKIICVKIDPGEAFSRDIPLVAKHIRISTGEVAGEVRNVPFASLPGNVRAEFLTTLRLITDTPDRDIVRFFTRRGTESLLMTGGTRIEELPALLIARRDVLKREYAAELATIPAQQRQSSQVITRKHVSPSDIQTALRVADADYQRRTTRNYAGHDFPYNIAPTDLQVNATPIGQGAYAEVYRGTWQHVGVAIKRFRVQNVSKSAVQEMSLLLRLRHPNIVLVFGVCVESMQCSMVMEFLAGGSLYDRLHKDQHDLPWSTRWQIALDISKGIYHLHHQQPPILHRDLKSPNILLDVYGHAKIADFGISLVQTETMLMLVSKTPPGTTLWLAPELMSDPETKYVPACDVYSCGVILWELAARQVPWAHASHQALVPTYVRDGKREKIPAEAPKTFASLISRCWDGRADQRPTIDVVVQELEAHQQEALP